MNHWLENRQRKQELVKCCKDFFYFVENYVKIRFQVMGMPVVSHLKLMDYQRRFLKRCLSDRFLIAKKFRIAGLSTLSDAYALWNAMFKLDQRITILCNYDRQAIQQCEIVKRMVNNLPAWMLGDLDRFTDHEISFRDTGGKLFFYTPEAACGRKVDLLILDEAAHIHDMHLHWNALYPVLACGSQVIAHSSVSSNYGWFQQYYEHAEHGHNSFVPYNCEYWENPSYGPAWAQNMKLILGDKGYRMEVLGEFVAEPPKKGDA